MNKITVTAKTLEEAITKATIQMGITSTELSYDIIEKGSAGFLGIGAKNCVIEAYKKEEKKEKPVVEVKKEAPVKTPAPTKKEAPVKEAVPAKKEAPVKAAAPAKKVETSKVESTKKEESVKSDKPAKKNQPAKNNHHNKKEYKKIEKPQVVREMVKIEDATMEATKKFIVDVLKSMNIEAGVTAVVDEEGALAINIDGKDMGVLIGKRGQTLDSLQYLANRVANKEQDGYIRVKLDTENYRERRQKTLENLAKNISYKVKRTRKPVSLEPMNPYERRIIHSALQDDPKIATHSEGEEPYRKVVVTLARK